jgi:hypothetical protein
MLSQTIKKSGHLKLQDRCKEMPRMQDFAPFVFFLQFIRFLLENNRSLVLSDLGCFLIGSQIEVPYTLTHGNSFAD